MEYPKINTLYKREGCGPFDEKKGRYTCDLEKKPRKSKILEGQYSCEEYNSIKEWSVDEKIDGTNIRIIYDRRKDPEDRLQILGRTDNAQFRTDLFLYLQKTFTLERMESHFKDASFVILFGEGYGPNIQTGHLYREDISFALFDAYIDGWWLTRQSIHALSIDLNIEHVPIIGYGWSISDIVQYVKMRPCSEISMLRGKQYICEGIIARSHPLMLTREGLPIMFKLKCKDFD